MLKLGAEALRDAAGPLSRSLAVKTRRFGEPSNHQREEIMTSWGQDFRFLAMVVTVTAMPAWAPSARAQTATPIPDFSGIWAHLTWPDTEPPLNGPGPVT